MVDPRKARHLLALFRRYRAYLDDLAARGDDELRADFAVMRFRNLLVHAYADVDEERVLRILHTSLSELDRFVEILRERFRNELEGPGNGGG